MHHHSFNTQHQAKQTKKLWVVITTLGFLFVFLIGLQTFSTSAAADRQSQSPSSISEIESLTLVNADNSTDIRVLVNNDVLDLSTLTTTNLNIRADIATGTSVGSVKFGLNNNDEYRIENVPPYYMEGDDGSWTPTVGAYVLTVTAYSNSNGGGTADTPIVINFTVTDGTSEVTPASTVLAYLSMTLRDFGPTPTNTPMSTATNTPEPTNTVAPGTTNTPTPTNTAAPPTNTPTPEATFTQVPGCADAQFEDDNGLIVIEIESQPAVGDWDPQTSIDGYTGSSFYRWVGANQGGTYGTDIIEYKIKVNTTGTYRFIWRSYNADSASDLGNDAFLRFPDVPAGDFYGIRSGTSIVYPVGSGFTPVANGSGGENWFKIFMSETSEWSWQAMTSDNNAHQIYVDFDNPGVYTMQISGRSRGYAIDRAVIYHSSISNQMARDVNNPETLCTP